MWRISWLPIPKRWHVGQKGYFKGNLEDEALRLEGMHICLEEFGLVGVLLGRDMSHLPPRVA